MSEAAVQTNPKVVEDIDDSFKAATWRDRYVPSFQMLPEELFLLNLWTKDNISQQKLLGGIISEEFFGKVFWHHMEGRVETDVITSDLKLSISESESKSYAIEMQKKTKRLTPKEAYILASDVLKSIEKRKMAYLEDEARFLSNIEED